MKRLPICMSQNVIQCNCNWTGPQPTAHVASAELPKLPTSMRAKENYLVYTRGCGKSRLSFEGCALVPKVQQVLLLLDSPLETENCDHQTEPIRIVRKGNHVETLVMTAMLFFGMRRG